MTLEKLLDTISDNKEVVVKFSAPWCAPCKMMAPVFEQVAKDEQFVAVNVDVDDNPEIAEYFEVLSVPFFKVFKDGVEVLDIVGYTPKPTLQERIRQALK